MAAVIGQGNQVYPAEGMDVAMTTVPYRRGAPTQMDREREETVRSGLTLEEARWSNMRKKIPGMSSIPKSKLKMYVDYDPEAEYMKNYRQFTRQHFHQKECYRFVPLPNQNVKRNMDLKCHCGGLLNEHAAKNYTQQHTGIGVSINTGRIINTVDAFTSSGLIPPELQLILQRQHEKPPKIFPKLAQPWSRQDIRKTFTSGYGRIDFINVEHSGGKKPAKYIRMVEEDSIDDLINMMKEYWAIMEPYPPNLVISVVGGAKNFKLDGRMRDTFSTGLIKAAKTTSAWLISSGFNMGVMKSVGQAVRQGQSFCWDNDRMAHILRCIGIAPWGYVKDRRKLDSGPDGQGLFDAEYRTSNNILHDQPVPLNPDHTHFIFVDDGYRNRYGGSAGVRAKLEQRISQSVQEGGLGIPVVLVVVEGGRDAISDARTSLEHKIPVVVCSGTGRAADILAYAYNHTKTRPDGVREMKPRHEGKLEDKIFDAYGKAWKPEDIETKVNEIKEWVKICCQNAELMTIFNMNKNEDLDLSILSVLLKAKKGADEEQRLSQLKLALTWDRVDIAQEEIFREDVLWSTESLHQVLTEAILQDKVKFVALILQQGVVMKEYLTTQRLEEFYKQVPKHNFIYQLLYKLLGREQLTRDNVADMLLRLLDRYSDSWEVQRQAEEVRLKEPMMFERPYKQLMIWAVLLNRTELAKFCWEMGDEPVTSAIAVTRIYQGMSLYLPRQESNFRDQILSSKREFEEMATEVLNECHQQDPQKSMMIVERKSPSWSMMTCLQLAASADDQVFLSSVACQNSISVTWKRGIQSSWERILLAMLFPPIIPFCLEILSMGVEMSRLEKYMTFYTSPISKFAYGTLMYVAFLVLHSYMVLVDFRPHEITALEIVIILWIFTYMLDALHILIVFPGPTLAWKLKHWYGMIWLDLFNFLLAFVGFIVHASSDHYRVSKVIYCINSILFFVRIMKFYTANASLGPKLVMIKRMVEELRMFIMVLLVFLLAYGVASQGLLYHVRTPTWDILKDVIYFPYWQLYGEIFLEELETDTCQAGTMNCRTFHWLVPFLLAAYLLVGNILLLNLLIAIFSHVFDTVEKNSIQIWKFQMYFLVMEYDSKTSLVAPFSIFIHVVLIVRWIFRKTCCRRDENKQHFGRRHLEYLQLFEKEMMANYLRRKKAEEMSGISTTIGQLQKRVDELIKLIEDEVISDQQPGVTGPTAVLTHDGTILQMLTREGSVAGPTWPPVQAVLGIKDVIANTPIPPEFLEMDKNLDKTKISEVAEKEKEEQETEPPPANEEPKKHRHKHKKKHKKRDKDKDGQREEQVIQELDTETKINNVNLPPNIEVIPDPSQLRQSKTMTMSDQAAANFQAWSPRVAGRRGNTFSDEENLLQPQRLRLSSVRRDIDSSEDSDSPSMFRRRMKKKKKKRNRGYSDSD